MDKYILKEFDGDLFQHQKEGIDFLIKNKKTILADEMGLGKTRQSVIAAMEDEKTKLVICPASLKINWKREIEIVDPKADIYIVESGPEEDLPEKDWIIINYSMLKKYKDQIIGMKEDKKIQTLIMDEAHYIKGRKTIRAKASLEIAKDMERVYCLTGTPIMNRPIELFPLLKAINHPLGKKYSFFSKRYCGAYLKTIVKKSGQIIRFWDESGATRLPELREMTKGAILRRTKDEVLDLPEKIISVEIVELDRTWRKKYDQAWDNYIEWVTNHSEDKNIENILSAQALVELVKLKQVCSQAKIKRMVSDIENTIEQESKVIVFSQFTGTIKKLREELIAKGIPSVRLTGQDSSEDRQESVDQFQKNPEIKVFIGNMKAAGVGINLTAASQVMFADMDWSPAIHDQATDRAHRIGQKGTVNVYYYVVEQTIEEDIIEILQSKLKTIKAIVEGKDYTEDGSLGKEFLKRLKTKLKVIHSHE